MALVVTLAVYTLGVTVVLACRAVWRALQAVSVAVSRPQTAPGDSRDAITPPDALSARTADRMPTWAQTDKEAA